MQPSKPGPPALGPGEPVVGMLEAGDSLDVVDLPAPASSVLDLAPDTSLKCWAADVEEEEINKVT